MNNADYISSSFKSGGIKRVLVVDDAFDPPSIDIKYSGALIDYLEKSAKSGSYVNFNSSLDEVQEIIKKIKNDFEQIDIQEFVEKVYAKYAENQNDEYDFDSFFDSRKGSNLSTLLPIVKFIEGIDPDIIVVRSGLNSAETDFNNEKPDIVFLDYYLDPGINPGGDLSDVAHQDARSASLTLLERFSIRSSGNMPAILLMSSEKVDSDVQGYRNDANKAIGDESRIASWRFRFINKNKIQIAGGEYIIDPSAADALLDVSQSYTFGNELNKGLSTWRESVESAIKSTIDEIGELDLKDFAYLIKFRLNEENQRLGEYVNWLFCECLMENISQALPESAFATFDVKRKDLELIEGSYDGATKKIAVMFDKARIERKKRPENFIGSRRLGDIYVRDTKFVRAIITPDCDLVVRDDGKSNVMNPLTVGGVLQAYKLPTVNLTNFIIIKEAPYSIKWNKKDVQAVNFTDEQNRDLKYEGTLKPIYAQELQSSILAEIGRVGVAVAPVIGITARAKAKMHLKGGKTHILVDTVSSEANCTIMPPRGGDDKVARVIFHRSFARNLSISLDDVMSDNVKDTDGNRPKNLPKPVVDLLDPQDYDYLKASVADEGSSKIYEILCGQGCQVGSLIDFGIHIVANGVEKRQVWCSIVIEDMPKEVSTILPVSN